MRILSETQNWLHCPALLPLIVIFLYSGKLFRPSICLGYLEAALKPRLCDCLGGRIFAKFPSQPSTVEPRYNKGPRDWQNLFAITRFRYIEVLFHIFYYYWGKENRSLYRGFHYMEVRYIEFSL